MTKKLLRHYTQNVIARIPEKVENKTLTRDSLFLFLKEKEKRNETTVYSSLPLAIQFTNE